MDAISSFLGTEESVGLIERPKFEETTESDIQIARKNLKELIDQGMEQVPSMLDQCQLLQDPKMYSAAAQFINSLKDLNQTLSRINAPLKPTEKQIQTPVTQPQQITQNNVYVGSTEDLIKSKKKQREFLDAL